MPSSLSSPATRGSFDVVVNPGSFGAGVNPGSLGAGVNPGSLSAGVNPVSLSAGVNPGSLGAGVNPGSLSAGVNPGSLGAGVNPGSFGSGVTLGYIPPAYPSRLSNISIGATNTAVVPRNCIPEQHNPELQPFPILHNHSMCPFAVGKGNKQEEDKI